MSCENIHSTSRGNKLNLTNQWNDSSLDDVHLTEKGMKQAQDVAEKLKDVKFGIIYVSEFLRTKQTAEIINKYHNVLLEADDRLNEQVTGFNGKLVSEYIEWIERQDDYWNMKFDNAESFADIQKRIYSFIEALKKQEFGNVLIVAHSSTIKFFCGYFEKMSNDEIFHYRKIENGEFFEFDA